MSRALTPEQDQVQREINQNIFKPISFEVFEKTPNERAILSTLKVNHKNYIKALGLDPKKVMNPPN